MNTRRGKAKFKNFRFVLESGRNSTILMGRLVETNCLKKYDVVQWNTQAGNITANIKIKVDFTLPALNAMNVVMWKFHMDDSAKGTYDLILGQDLIT